MIVRAATAFAVLLVLPLTGSGETSQLNGIRYSVREMKSRVTFRFTGTVAYSAGKSDNVITLVFREVSVGSPPGEARLSFVSGAVQGVDLRRAGKDSAVATIRLRNDDRVEYSSSEDGHALYVDVLGGTERAALTVGTGRTSSSTPQKAVKKIEPSSLPGEVIKASVREEEASPLSHPAQSAPDRLRPPETGVLISILLSLTVSSVGTIAILWFYVRRRNGKHSGDLQPGNTATLELALGTLSLPRLSVPATPDPEESPVRPSGGETEGDDPGLALAERLQRSRSELDFAIQLSSIPYPNGLGRELTATHAASLSKAQRTVVAKKLGVGRGELDLMANLSRMKDQAKEGNHD
jgi:hypothetical protein